MDLLDAEFPQHAKIAAFSDIMVVLHAFIHTDSYVLCTWNEMENAYVPTEKSHSVLIDEFFDIDREELEKEDRVMRSLLIDLLARDGVEDLVEQLEAMQKEEDDD